MAVAAALACCPASVSDDEALLALTAEAAALSSALGVQVLLALSARQFTSVSKVGDTLPSLNSVQ